MMLLIISEQIFLFYLKVYLQMAIHDELNEKNYNDIITGACFKRGFSRTHKRSMISAASSLVILAT